MTNLSPDVQAVMTACDDAVERLPLSSTKPEQFSIALIAAAFRKLEDILAQDRAEPLPPDLERAVLTERIRLFRRTTAIAAELEGQ